MSRAAFRSTRLPYEQSDAVQCSTSYCLHGARNAIEIGNIVLFLCDDCTDRLRAATKELAQAIHNEREARNATKGSTRT